jgi:hypothetical protein
MPGVGMLGGPQGLGMRGGPGGGSQPPFGGFQGNGPPVGRQGIGPGSPQPGPGREFKPDVVNQEALSRLLNQKVDAGPFLRSPGATQPSKTHQWDWPAWVCWESALGLVAVCLVIGFLYGRFGPLD